LSRAEFARLTKLGEATLVRWEKGSLIQNPANDQYLRLLGFEDNIRRLRNWVEGAAKPTAGAGPRARPTFAALTVERIESLRVEQTAFSLCLRREPISS
jgi:hypothetical protein